MTTAEKTKKPSRIVGALKTATSYEQVKGMGVLIWQMAATLDPRKIKPGRVETFDEARTRLQVNNDELEACRLNHGRIFWLSLVMIAIAWAVRFSYGLSFLGVVLTLSFTAMCGALMFRHSFRASQIKARKLHSVKEWATNPAHWFPDVL